MEGVVCVLGVDSMSASIPAVVVVGVTAVAVDVAALSLYVYKERFRLAPSKAPLRQARRHTEKRQWVLLLRMQTLPVSLQAKPRPRAPELLLECAYNYRGHLKNYEAHLATVDTFPLQASDDPYSSAGIFTTTTSGYPR